MAEENGKVVEAVIAAEMRLLEPVVRASPELVSELLDPEFVEFVEVGSSGRRWDAESILAVTSSGSVDPGSPVRVSDVAGVVLVPGVVHLNVPRRQQGTAYVAEFAVASDGVGLADVLPSGHAHDLSVPLSRLRRPTGVGR